MSTSTIDCVLREARQQLELGDCPAAVAQLLNTIGDSPDDGRLWDLLGIAHWDSGSVPQAIDALEHAMVLVPLSPEGQLALGLAYEVLQKRELARGLFIGLAGRDDLSSALLEQLARALGRAGETPIALHVCERAARQTPDCAAPLLGMVYYMQRLSAPVERILPLLFRALHLEPDDFTIRILLARRLHESGLSEEAAEILRVVEAYESICPSCLRSMRDIFAAVQDEARATQCVHALRKLGDESL